MQGEETDHNWIWRVDARRANGGLVWRLFFSSVSSSPSSILQSLPVDNPASLDSFRRCSLALSAVSMTSALFWTANWAFLAISTPELVCPLPVVFGISFFLSVCRQCCAQNLSFKSPITFSVHLCMWTQLFQHHTQNPQLLWKSFLPSKSVSWSISRYSAGWKMFFCFFIKKINFAATSFLPGLWNSTHPGVCNQPAVFFLFSFVYPCLDANACVWWATQIEPRCAKKKLPKHHFRPFAS